MEKDTGTPPTTIGQVEPLLLTAQQITDQQIVPVALRTWRRMDSAGRCPRGLRCGSRKVWRVADLRKWVELGCPDRREFEARMREEGKRQ